MRRLRKEWRGLKWRVRCAWWRVRPWVPRAEYDKAWRLVRASEERAAQREHDLRARLRAVESEVFTMLHERTEGWKR